MTSLKPPKCKEKIKIPKNSHQQTKKDPNTLNDEQGNKQNKHQIALAIRERHD
jgi:hypothetical protein